MKVNISQVRLSEQGMAHYELVDDFSSFRLEGVTLAAPIHIELQVNNTGESLFAQGNIRVELRVSCGRCLEEFSYPLDLVYQDEWVYSPVATEEQKENALLFDKDDIELDERIYEQIVLAIPMKFLCSPECRGLCSRCGANLNKAQCTCVEYIGDPRLAALSNWHSEE